MLDTLKKRFQAALDRYYVRSDQKRIETTRSLRLVPPRPYRTGGKVSYGEWCHVAGIFQSLLFIHLPHRRGNEVLDVGCGTGLMAIAAEPFLSGGGRYVGIDIRESNIEFCRTHYPANTFSFVHHPVGNPAYVAVQAESRQSWSIETESMDAVTALSVWTHLNEEEAVFYFREIDRVLRVGGRAVITFFLVDGDAPSEPARRAERLHNRGDRDWVFDTPASSSQEWRHPAWVRHPEEAMGVTRAGLQRLLRGTRLRIIQEYPGTWKDSPGVFFQDVLVFDKFGYE